MMETSSTTGDTRHYWALTLLFCVALTWAIVPGGFSFGLGAFQAVGAIQGSIVRRVQWLPLFLFGAYIVWVRRDVSLALARHVNPFLPAFLIWIAASMLWSPYPQVTLRKVVLFAGVCVIALAFQVASWNRDRLTRLLCLVLTTALVASVAVVLLLPHIGLNGPPDYDWRGVCSDKNTLGQLAAVTFLLWVHVLAARRARLAVVMPALALSAFVLIGAHSATSLVGVVALSPLVWFMLRRPLATRHGLLIGLLAVFIVTALCAFVYIALYGLPGWSDLVSPFAHAAGRNATLSGRLEIWRRVWFEVTKHPWLGQGFGAFWLGAHGPAQWVTADLYGILWQAHNGYLDVLNETGIIGSVLATGFLCFYTGQVLFVARYDRANAAAHLTILGFFMFDNLTESSIFRPVDFLFFLSIMASLGLSRAQADIAIRRTHGRDSLADRVSPSVPLA